MKLRINKIIIMLLSVALFFFSSFARINAEEVNAKNVDMVPESSNNFNRNVGIIQIY